MGIHFHRSLVSYRSSSPSSFSHPFSQRFTKFLSVFILSKVFKIIVSFFAKVVTIFHINTLASHLTFLRTHLGISVVTKSPRVSPKILRTHLGVSVVVEFPRVSPNSIHTHLGISVVAEFPRVSPKFLRTHLRISVVTKFPRVSPIFLRTHLRISVVTKFPRA